MTAKDPVRVIRECPLCETIHYGERALCLHLFITHFERTCPLCNYTLPGPSGPSLFDHMKAVHPGMTTDNAMHAFLLGITPK